MVLRSGLCRPPNLILSNLSSILLSFGCQHSIVVYLDLGQNQDWKGSNVNNFIDTKFLQNLRMLRKLLIMC